MWAKARAAVTQREQGGDFNQESGLGEEGARRCQEVVDFLARALDFGVGKDTIGLVCVRQHSPSWTHCLLIQKTEERGEAMLTK